jgi:proteic killer suppression protein
MNAIDKALAFVGLGERAPEQPPRRLSLALQGGGSFGALKADRLGQHSIRVNDQWRICFVWREGGAAHVEIVDTHD